MRVAIGCDRTQSAFASKVSGAAAIKRISPLVNTIVRPFGMVKLTDGAVTDRLVTAVIRQFIGCGGLRRKKRVAVAGVVP